MGNMKEKNKEIPVVKSSLPCHSNVGRWDGGNLWEAAQKSKIVMDGFRKHRSQALAQSSVGMTCILKPALPFPFRAKRGQITKRFDGFRRREAFKGLQSLFIINGQQRLCLFYVLPIEDIVAQLEEDAEIDAKTSNLLHLLRQRIH